VTRAAGPLARVLAVLALTGALNPARADDWHFATEPFPPYTYAIDGHAAGPMADVLETVCKRLQRQCLVEVMPWRRALMLAGQGDVDGLFTVVDTPERRAAFRISAPVIEARYAFIAFKGDRFDYHRPQDLNHRTIGVYGPSATATMLLPLLEGNEARAIIEPDNEMVLRKMEAHRYGDDGLVFMNERVAEDILARQGVTDLHTAGEATRFSYAFGFAPKRVSAADVAAFDAELAALCRSGQLQNLLTPYRMRPPPCPR